MPEFMKSCRLHAIRDLRCDNVEIPMPHGEELLIRVSACGICGSDIPRVYEHGTSNGKYPLAIGHEFAGEVVAVGENADSSLIGKKGAIYPLIPCRKCEACQTGEYAMCEDYDYLGSRRDGGFAEYCLIPSAWNFIPSSWNPYSASQATPEELAMTEPACVAQHSVRRSGVKAGQFLVIYGAGPIGIMAARWAEIFGASALLVDIDDNKVRFSRAKGLVCINPSKDSVCATVREMNGGRLADAAIEGTGASAGLTGCIAAVRFGATIALLGNPRGDITLSNKIHSMLLRKELHICGVWNSSRAPVPIDEWKYTVSMMDKGIFKVGDLITTRVGLDALPKTIEDIRFKRLDFVKAMYVK